MLVKQRMALDTFTQVNSFIDSSPAVLANPPEGYADQVQIFKTSLAVIQQATTDQATGSASQTAAQRQAARQALRIGQLHPLRKIARVLERSVAGMPHLVSIPRKTASTQNLLAAARSAVQDVTPFQAQFVGKGMPSNFLDHLNQAIQTVQDADSSNAAAKQVTKSAQGQLTTAINEAKDSVTCLDVIIRRACAADPANGTKALGAWNAIVPPPAKLTAPGNSLVTSAVNGTAASAVAGTAAAVGTSAASGSPSAVTGTSTAAGQAAVAPSGSGGGSPAVTAAAPSGGASA